MSQANIMRAPTWIALLFATMYFVTTTVAGDPSTPFRISEVLELKSANTESIPASDSPEASTIHVSKDAIITGSDVKRFLPQHNKEGEWQILIVLNKAGADKFRAASERLVDKQLAIILDGKLMSSPFLRAPITDGMIVISGSFEEAWLVRMTSYFEGRSE